MTVIDVSREDVCRRAGPDVGRHRWLAKQKLRDKMRQLIAEVDVIGMQSRSRRFKVLLPVMETYRFEFSRRKEVVGSNPTSGPAQRGGKIVGSRKDKSGKAGGGGEDGGEPVYETYVGMDDIREFLFADLELPDFIQKQLRTTPVEEKGGMVGVTRKGPISRLHRRASIKQKNRRVMGQKREGVDVYDGFIDDDLRFRRISTRIRPVSNAVCIFLMDVSGSMGWQQKYLCRAFFWLLNEFVKTKYQYVETVYITHHSTASEVDEDLFFHTTESGGTICSSAYQLALDVIKDRYPVEAWNIYGFHMSDGDNWQDDNRLAVALAEALCQTCNLFGYGQVSGWMDNAFSEDSVDWHTMFKVLDPLRKKYRNLSLVRIRTEEDVYPQFRKMLEREKIKKGGTK